MRRDCSLYIASLMEWPAMVGAVALATTHHDPEQRMDRLTLDLLPALRQVYPYIALIITPDTPLAPALAQMPTLHLHCLPADFPGGMQNLGRVRRMVVEQAFALAPTISHIHLCDFDRILHWVAYYRDELQEVVAQIPLYDVTVLGRTARAFASHPRTQRDTEQIINHVFALASGRAWDVTAAARGLSRRASNYLVQHCADATVGIDCSWVLCALRHPELTHTYRETEGLEFETPDRYPAEIAAAGGVAAWVATLDAHPQQWLHRTQVAALEIESITRWAATPA